MARDVPFVLPRVAELAEHRRAAFAQLYDSLDGRHDPILL